MDVSVTSVVLLCVAWAAVLVSLWPLQRLARPSKARKNLSPVPQATRDVSVVVLADGDPEGLINLVNNIKRQVFAGNYQIILAVDPVSPALTDTVRQLQHFNPEIYVTFVPEDSRNVSRRKLAIYLGVKASRHDEIVFVTSGTEVLDSRWLQSVDDCFVEGKDVVVSPVTVRSMPGKGFVKRLRECDFALTTLTWFSAALLGRCYRGTSENIAYRKSVFFANKGFAGNLNYHFGDDDIFISEISTPRNVAVNLDRAGLAGMRTYGAEVWEDIQRRRLFTSTGLGKGPRRLTSALGLMAWINLVSVILALLWAGGNLFLVLASSLALPALWALDGFALSRAFGFLDANVPGWLIYPCLLGRPALTLRRRLTMRLEKEKNYTWRRVR